ncbi:hypothetical protein FA15DRAFT_125185 [Coprinopsis marcescibilis]|uniref:Uncharacterized protein n=1 Tax=Coprinopsis marcescibilis TaxID=230819 RepID=A0A5C3KKL4_COPMA|nr:hypothetical protein FA15DRAFT_125185 [Coprinopsis marcescibilis]
MTTEKPLIILIHDAQRKLVPRPESELELRRALPRYFSRNMMGPIVNGVTFSTNELPISKGKWLTITPDVWPEVIEKIGPAPEMLNNTAASHAGCGSITLNPRIRKGRWIQYKKFDCRDSF